MDRKTQLNELTERLNRMQKTISDAEGTEISDTVFAQRYLPFSLTTLCRIKNSDHPYEGNLDNIDEKLSQAEGELDERLASVRQTRDTEKGFVQTTLAKATQSSIKKARDSRFRRVVVLLAPTGAGKSEVGKMLASRGAIYIEGRQSWRKSYKAFCGDIAKAAGRPMKVKDYNEHAAEERMLQALSSRNNILYIDEANTLSPECVNAIKLMVNVTGSVVAVAMVPSSWDKLTEGAEDEMAQLFNRCQPILRYKCLNDDDVRPFLERSNMVKAEIEKVLPSVVEAANEFGSIKSVVALVDDIKSIVHPAYDDVMSIIKFNAKNTAQSGVKKGVTK